MTGRRNAVRAWRVTWLIALVTASAAADPVRCFVVRKPTRDQVADRQAEMVALKNEFNADPDRPVALLEAIYNVYPEPVVGKLLAEEYLHLGRHEDALAVLVEVARQQPEQIYERIELQQRAVEDARLLFEAQNGTLESIPVLIFEAQGAHAPVAVWLDEVSADHRCAGTLEVQPGPHRILWTHAEDGRHPLQSGQDRRFVRQAVHEQIYTLRVPAFAPAAPKSPEADSEPDVFPERRPRQAPEGQTDYWLLGAGLAATVVGFGGANLMHYYWAEHEEAAAQCTNKRCTGDGARKIENAMLLEDLREPLIGVGVVGLGLVAYALHDSIAKLVGLDEKPASGSKAQPSVTAGATTEGVVLSLGGEF